MGRHLVRQTVAKEELAVRKREGKKDEKPALAAGQSLTEKLSRPVSSLSLKGLYHNTARVCISQLEKKGVETLGDLVKLKEEDLLQMRYVRGEKFRKALKKELAGMGLTLGMGSNPGESLASKLAKRTWVLEDACKKVAERHFGFHSRMDQNDVRRVFELVEKTEGELVCMKMIGPKSLDAIKLGLAEMGLSLGMKLDMKTLLEVKRLLEKGNPVDQQDVPRIESRIQRAEEGRTKLLSTPVQEIEWRASYTARYANTLQLNNINYLFELVQKTREDLLRIKNFNTVTVHYIEKRLEEDGLSLGMKLDDATLAGLKASIPVRANEASAPAQEAEEERYRILSKHWASNWPAANALLRADIVNVFELVHHTREEILSIEGVGKAKLRKIEKWLGGLGLSLGMKLDVKTLEGLEERGGDKDYRARLLRISKQLDTNAKTMDTAAQVATAQAEQPVMPAMRGLPLMYGTAIMVNQPMEEFMELVEKGSAELNELRKLVRPQNVESLSKLLDFFRMLPFAEASASHSGFVGMGVVGDGGRQLVYGTAVMVTRPVEEFQGLLEKSQEELGGLKRLVQPQAMESLGKLLDFFSSPSNEEARKAFEAFVGENKPGAKPN